MNRWIFLLILSLAACKGDKGIICTEEARTGLQVRVISESTFESVTEGISVVAIEGDFQEELELVPGSTDFTGLIERAGTYTIIVSGPEFIPVTLGNVVIQRDECHVITEFLQIFIKAA
jgi:hypothetical protein